MTPVILLIICPDSDVSKFLVCKLPIVIFRRQYYNINDLNSFIPEQIVANLVASFLVKSCFFVDVAPR
jgi:hypothetical protein